MVRGSLTTDYIIIIQSKKVGTFVYVTFFVWMTNTKQVGSSSEWPPNTCLYFN
jgi:hypothetical protein